MKKTLYAASFDGHVTGNVQTFIEPMASEGCCVGSSAIAAVSVSQSQTSWADQVGVGRTDTEIPFPSRLGLKQRRTQICPMD